MIKILHGCTKIRHIDNQYMYTEVKVGADRPLDSETINHTFSVDVGEVPEIGDFIVADMLVKRKELQVNSDWRMWRDKDLYGNP